MESQGDQRELVEALHKFMERTDKLMEGRSGNFNNLQVTGMGSFWNGVAIGVAVGSAILCAVWVADALGDMREDQRQDDAFIQATYQAVPGLREQFDKLEKPDE